MLIVGLTGNIGSGKSSVARLLERRGVPLIDADVLAREAVAPGSPALKQIVARWGRRVLDPDGGLDRSALRDRVFGHLAELEALNAMVHPEVRRLRDMGVATARARGEPVVVCDIPLLFEAHMEKEVDLIVLVDAPRELRLARLIEHRGLSQQTAEAIMATQQSSDAKRDLAAYVIRNDGSLEDFEREVDVVWRDIEKRIAPRQQ